MSTEYRRGIPSTAHVEAATRLGLEWEEVRTRRNPRRWRFQIRGGELWCDFRSDVSDWDRDLEPLSSGRLADRTDIEHYTFRPILPDGTLVDWEVLDQEVARAGQAVPWHPDYPGLATRAQTLGWDGTGSLWGLCAWAGVSSENCAGPGRERGIASTINVLHAYITGREHAQSPTQPQGFRADLWRRIAPFYAGTGRTSLAGLEAPAGFWNPETDARWTVYQELKPLYDLVDGAQGEAAMPMDVVEEYSRRSSSALPYPHSWRLCRDADSLFSRFGSTSAESWRPSEGYYGVPLRNFATVLDAVAERRVAERGQPQAPTVTSAQPEPRRFADVRPDRHGWRWWRIVGAPDAGIIGARFEAMNVGLWCWLAMADGAVPTGSLTRGQAWSHLDIWGSRTIIPTDEQGNPVSWESIGPTDPTEIRLTSASGTPDRFFSAEPSSPPRPSQFSNNPATPPLTPEGFQQALETVQMVPGLYQETLDWVTRQISQAIIGVDTAKAPPITTLSPPLPRFTADELNDVDHSKTTKLDEITLRRGKLPTVEQIAKYREVRARRTGGAVADALKESRIDCEVAQYVLERWAGGLDNTAAHKLIAWVVETTDVGLGLFVCSAEARAQQWIDHHSPTLDTSEKPSPTMQRERQEAEERRQRLAELRQRLTAERAAQPTEKEPTTASRFDLIEPDPQADPAASVRAWEARQAAAKVRPVTVPRTAKPATAPRRPAIEVVDAEVDGLSRSEVFAALFGRALNGGC